jgi:hypothetical protein
VPQGRVERAAGRLPLLPTLAVVGAVVLVVQLPGDHATAWHYFEDAVDLLVGSGPEGHGRGLGLYRDRPDLQFGPLSIVVATPFVLLGPTVGPVAAMVAASGAGLVAFALLADAVDRITPGWRSQAPATVLLSSGVLFVVAWGDVAVRTAHVDDAVALLAVVAAVRWCAMGRSGAVVAALAVAAAAKPWAVALAPLAAVAPARPSVALGRVVLVGSIALATWAPFVLAEPATLDTSGFGIANDPTSVLRALGVDDPTTPSWVRPVQLAGGLAVVALVVGWGWWPSAVLAAVAWRLLVEPGAHRYYTIGVVLGGLLVELAVRRGRVPWCTLAAAAVLEATAVPGFPAVPGRWLRLAVVLAALGAVVLVGLRPPGRRRPG